MSHVARRLRPALIAYLPLFALALVGCGGEDVSREALQDARARWTKAGLRNYDLEWQSTGPRDSHYAVTVRDGLVQKVEGFKPDGSRIPLKPADTKLYSVNGLFTVVADELAMCDTERPFGQPKGTKAVLRFTTDPTLGYLKSYRRDVIGAPRGLAIDVLRFTPVDPGAGASPK